jgi:hypothetical protein
MQRTLHHSKHDEMSLDYYPYHDTSYGISSKLHRENKFQSLLVIQYGLTTMMSAKLKVSESGIALSPLSSYSGNWDVASKLLYKQRKSNALRLLRVVVFLLPSSNWDVGMHLFSTRDWPWTKCKATHVCPVGMCDARCKNPMNPVVLIRPIQKVSTYCIICIPTSSSMYIANWGKGTVHCHSWWWLQQVPQSTEANMCLFPSQPIYIN